MQGQGGYQILDYREFTSENYEKIYNLITTNKMYLIEHFKTDEVEEISLFLTAIKNENDITFLYNNKTQTLVYAKSGITNNLGQGGGVSEESKYKIIDLGNISNGITISGKIILEITNAIASELIFSFVFTYKGDTYLVVPTLCGGISSMTFNIPRATFDPNSSASMSYNDIAILKLNDGKVYIYQEDITKCVNLSGNSLEVGSELTLSEQFDLVGLISEDRYSVFAYVNISTEGLPTIIYYTPIIYYGTDTKAYMLICGNAILICSISGTGLTIVGTNKFLNSQLIDLGTLSLSGGTISGIYDKIKSAFDSDMLIYFTANIGSKITGVPTISENISEHYFACIINLTPTISYELIFNSDDTYRVIVVNGTMPVYNTLQVSGIESIAVNSSITTSIQSLTDKNTIITSIKPSVAGVIVSAPYYDETDSCYKTTILNATTSAVSDLTLTIDYCRLIKD